MGELYDKIEILGKERGFDNITVLCKAAGVSRAVMSELKSGRTGALSIKNASKIADTLDVPIGMLIGDVGALALLEMAAEDNGLNNAANLIVDFRQRFFKSEPGFDDFTYAMHNESSELTEEDKSLLLAMAKQLSEKNRKNGKAE